MIVIVYSLLKQTKVNIPTKFSIDYKRLVWKVILNSICLDKSILNQVLGGKFLDVRKTPMFDADIGKHFHLFRRDLLYEWHSTHFQFLKHVGTCVNKKSNKFESE